MKTAKMAVVVGLMLCMGSTRLLGGSYTISWEGGDIPTAGHGVRVGEYTVSDRPAGSMVTIVGARIIIDDRGNPSKFDCDAYQVNVYPSSGGGAWCPWASYGGHTDGGCDSDPEDDTDIDLDQTSSLFYGQSPNQKWSIRISCFSSTSLGCATRMELTIYYREPVTVPDVVGLSEFEAGWAIYWAGLVEGAKQYAESDTVPAGQVIAQSPAAGTTVFSESEVGLTISTGPAPSQIQVPDVVGLSESEAVSAIGSAGLTVGTKQYAESDTAPAGQVTAQDPVGGTMVGPGSEVVLTISTGPEPSTQIQVPDVVGLAQAAARRAIVASGLVAGTVTETVSNTMPRGNVISQDPSAGTSVTEGSAVNLVVSAGPPARIVWVSDGHKTIAGATTPDDHGWVDLLRSAGYEVDYQPPSSEGIGFWRTLDAAKLATLDAADLVIISRDTSGAEYGTNAAEVTQWNGLKSPLILLNSYLVAQDRWLWLNSTSMGARQSYYLAQAIDPEHPIFEEVTLNAAGQVVWLDGAVAPGFSSCINTADPGQGHTIAARPDNGCILVAEWAAGAPFYAGSTQTPGDRRMFFSAGTQETANTLVGYGVYDLTAEGGIMFLNAVGCMIGEASKPAVVQEGLVGWWKLDETAGDIAFDSAGKSDGRTYGAPVWLPADGRVDGALRLDGVDDYVDCGNAATLNIRDKITLACWMKVGSFTRSWQTILAKGDSSYRLSRSGGPSSAGDGNALHFAIGPYADQYVHVDGAVVVTDDQWRHVAAVYDGSRVAIYVNGVLDKAAAGSGPIGDSSYNVFIGENSEKRGRCLSGLLDDVRIYDRALSIEEVRQLMSGDSGSTDSTGLVENFSFERPGTVTIKGWNGEGVAGTPTVDIPGWSSDLAASDSGVQIDPAATDGIWIAFLRARDQAVWQLTNHTLAAGEIFELKVDAANGYQTAAASLTMTLYYDDEGRRMPVATRSVSLTDAMGEYALSFTATAVPECIGKRIGVEFTNTARGTTQYLRLDNVQLTFSRRTR